MKKIIFITIFSFSVLAIYGQNQKTIKYNYNSTTNAALAELLIRTKGDLSKYQLAVNRLDSLQSLGKIILSTSEYTPIENRLKKYKAIPDNTEQVEINQYILEAQSKYVPVTELIK